MSTVAVLLLDVALKASLLCLVTFAAIGLAANTSAALRHDLGRTALACCLLLPFLSAIPSVTGPVSELAPMHVAANAVVTALPAKATASGLATFDRIWSGDGGSIFPDWLGSLLGALWLGGASLAVVRIFRNYSAAGQIVRRAKPYSGLGAPAGARVLLTEELSAPAVFGHQRPAILLPLEAVSWRRERLEAVLAHELAHIERRDWAAEWVLELASSLHWYNPLLLNLARRVRTEREIACDERVLAGGLDSREYADTLVGIARDARHEVPSPLLAMARPPELQRRVEKILAWSGKSVLPAWLRRVLSLAVLALFIPAAALTAPASGLLGAGSVQADRGPLSGLDDPMSELVPFPYSEWVGRVAKAPTIGAEGAAIARLKSQLDRRPRGYGDLVRERAIWTLAQARDGRLLEPLAEKVADQDWRVRAYVAWGMAATANRRATPLLAAMLDDPVWRVRAMAVGGLGEIADPAAAASVAATIDDPAWQVRMGAIDYAERLGDPAFIRRIRPLLHDPHTGTRLRAEEALSQL